MRFLRLSSMVLGLSMLSATPAFAATYGWPVMISQKVTLTNVSLPYGTTVSMTCYLGTATSSASGIAKVSIPVTQTPGGGYSYSNTLTVAIWGTGPGTPQTGTPVACYVYALDAQQRGPVLGQSIMKLP